MIAINKSPDNTRKYKVLGKQSILEGKLTAKLQYLPPKTCNYRKSYICLPCQLTVQLSFKIICLNLDHHSQGTTVSNITKTSTLNHTDQWIPITKGQLCGKRFNGDNVTTIVFYVPPTRSSREKFRYSAGKTHEIYTHPFSLGLSNRHIPLSIPNMVKPTFALSSYV